VFGGDPESFTLSGKGISAVLLKMDEFQGRIGMPGALIRKGGKPETSVLPPLPVPVIRMAKVSDAPSRNLTESEAAALKPLLWQNKEVEENCADIFPGTLTLTPLDEGCVLISTQCWVAAYNDGSAYWVMDNALKGKPEFVTSDGSDYGGGVIYASHKGRGLGDCWDGRKWVWDGREFRQSSEWHTGMCRGIRAGGAWHLPTLVTRVIDENGKDISSE
jgi:hypothetical protein